MAYRDNHNPYVPRRDALKRQLAQVIDEIERLEHPWLNEKRQARERPLSSVGTEHTEHREDIDAVSRHCEFLQHALEEAREVLDALHAPTPPPEYKSTKRKAPSTKEGVRAWFASNRSTCSKAAFYILASSLIGFFVMSSLALVITTNGWYEASEFCRGIALALAAVFVISLPCLLIVLNKEDDRDS